MFRKMGVSLWDILRIADVIWHQFSDPVVLGRDTTNIWRATRMGLEWLDI